MVSELRPNIYVTYFCNPVQKRYIFSLRYMLWRKEGNTYLNFNKKLRAHTQKVIKMVIISMGVRAIYLSWDYVGFFVV